MKNTRELKPCVICEKLIHESMLTCNACTKTAGAWAMRELGRRAQDAEKMRRDPRTDANVKRIAESIRVGMTKR